MEVLAVKTLMNALNSADPNTFIEEINKTMIPLYVQVRATNDPDLSMRFQNQLFKLHKLIHGTGEISFHKTQILQVGGEPGSIGGRGSSRTTKALISSIREVMEDSE